MGATGNREFTVFSTNYWTLRIFYDNNVRFPQFAAKLYYVGMFNLS